ncbi:MAG: hypothetical protein F2951_05720 [Actinobacteria bacterium]|jgi:uncharacterized damage-inducible protein DinB|nr:hypothetical protein [Actinomycetota bacterium]MSX48618.1 hypothetical protein [Actinomycetota bacterium]MSX62620.1 hypothetical protein [Actinomycetota bacterium]MSY10377.1 hypothetical protein [Actinomycetota bacterium]MSY55205.1 hypothetical protein [Actinomycetota bacterium]
MSIEMGIEKLIKHMGWANQQIIKKLGELPDEALESYVVNPEWTVAEIIRHILSSADWYGFRLTGEMHVEFDAPKSTKEMIEFSRMAAGFDDRLLRACAAPEALIPRDYDGKIIMRARSTILSQAVHHATEHRAQLVAALELRGYATINLDDFDVWGFADAKGE